MILVKIFAVMFLSNLVVLALGFWLGTRWEAVHWKFLLSGRFNVPWQLIERK